MQLHHCTAALQVSAFTCLRYQRVKYYTMSFTCLRFQHASSGCNRSRQQHHCQPNTVWHLKPPTIPPCSCCQKMVLLQLQSFRQQYIFVYSLPFTRLAEKHSAAAFPPPTKLRVSSCSPSHCMLTMFRGHTASQSQFCFHSSMTDAAAVAVPRQAV